MTMQPEILLLEPMMDAIDKQFEAAYVMHRPGPTGVPADVAGRIRGIATGPGAARGWMCLHMNPTCPRPCAHRRASATVETRLTMGKLVVANLLPAGPCLRLSHKS